MDDKRKLGLISFLWHTGFALGGRHDMRRVFYEVVGNYHRLLERCKSTAQNFPRADTESFENAFQKTEKGDCRVGFLLPVFYRIRESAEKGDCKEILRILKEEDFEAAFAEK